MSQEAVLVTPDAAEFILPSGGMPCGIFGMIPSGTNAHMECRALLLVHMIKYFINTLAKRHINNSRQQRMVTKDNKLKEDKKTILGVLDTPRIE